MKLFFSDAQLAHKPKQYMVHGRIVDPFESPERATTLLNALEKCGLMQCQNGEVPGGALRRSL